MVVGQRQALPQFHQIEWLEVGQPQRQIQWLHFFLHCFLPKAPKCPLSPQAPPGRRQWLDPNLVAWQGGLGWHM